MVTEGDIKLPFVDKEWTNYKNKLNMSTYENTHKQKGFMLTITEDAENGVTKGPDGRKTIE